LYFACTNGGAAKLGQIFRLRPQATGADRLQLSFASTDPDQMNYGDNLTIAANGQLVVCEDQYAGGGVSCLRGGTPDGSAYAVARARVGTEWAGACFPADGKGLFVNRYRLSRTLAITGPWSP